MQSMLVILSLALLAVVAVSAEGDDVVILTEANFDKTIKDNEFVLVEFFAPWCGHCKKLAPEYARAATTLKKDGIVLGSVDATVEKDLGNKFEVRGYPTLKFFKNGVPTEYKGGRTEDTIVSWLRKATGPAAKLVAGKAAIDGFAADAKVAVVGFFASAESEEYKNLVAVAKKDEDNAFAYTVNADDATAFGVTVPSIILFKKFDEGKAVLASGLTETGIAEFIAVQGTPLVIPFSMDVVASIFQSKLGKVAFLFTETENKDFAELAKEYRGKLVFATADSSVDRLNSHVGLTKEDFPKLLILTTDGQMVKYPSDAGVTKEGLKSHIDSFLAGNAKPFFKSEEVPKENNGPVAIVVGKNFKEVVLDSTKDVLLEIYAPWCGHCKQLEPKWNELGEFYESEDSIVIAKMDGTANEVDGISVRGFPTIRFFPAGENKKVGGEEYQGGREVADFKTFLQANAKSLKSKPAAKEDL